MTYLSLSRMVFWASAAGIAYAYLGYPALVRLLAAGVGRSRAARKTGDRPSLAVIIPAYNEESVIGRKIENVLSCDYPRDLLDIVVVSDCSTDGTDAIVRRYAERGIRLIRQETRRGKTHGLNRAMETIGASIVVFTDANAMFPTGLLEAFAVSFAEPHVGVVTGRTLYEVSSDSGVTRVTNVYTELERFIKRSESSLGSCVGADGAVFAMRRSLYEPLCDGDINDLVLPLKAVDKGYRCVFDDEVFCVEESGGSVGSEYRRQSRITNRTLRALWQYRNLFNPFRNLLFSWFLFSHKMMRFLVPFFLAAAAFSNLFLLGEGSFYAVSAAVQATIYGVALVKRRGKATSGKAGNGLSRIPTLCHAFVVINLAILDGWRKALGGKTEVTWQHERSTEKARG